MRGLDQAGVARRRLDLAGGPEVLRVEMARGRAGYGFTIVGQRPCVLSGIVKGSPAHVIGLRPGDRVLSVNGADVSDAAHEAVVKLIGSSAAHLRLTVAQAGAGRGMDSCSSDEDLVLHTRQSRGPQVFGSFPEHSARSSFVVPQKISQSKQRPISEPDLSYWVRQGGLQSAPVMLESSASVFTDPFQSQSDLLLDGDILNVAMVVGYISSTHLDLTQQGQRDEGEAEGLGAVHRCITSLSMERSTHSVMVMRVLCDCVQLCNSAGAVLITYPAERLVLCTVCPEDRRFFGLVTANASGVPGPNGAEASGGTRTLCHVFFVDPELYHHHAHKSILGHFGIECTPDPDTNGCLEFPQTPCAIVQFISVLYSDMGDFVERLRTKAEKDVVENDGNAGHSGGGDSSPENALARHRSHSMGNIPSRVWPDLPPFDPRHRGQNGFLRRERRCLLSEPLSGPAPSLAEPESSAWTRPPPPPYDHGAARSRQRRSQHWRSMGIRARWQRSSDAEAQGHAGPESFAPAWRAVAAHNEPAKKPFGLGQRDGQGHKENKGSRFWGIGSGRSSVRRTSGRSKRLSMARSLDDLETAAASDSELRCRDLQGCGSESSLNSNGSLPGAQVRHRLPEGRVASWAVSFERLLQDPVGISYFSEFLKKEFSEENILFWQACELFSQVPEDDKKQLSQKAQEIYNSFLSSKATMPVNIDSQAQLADNVLNAPQPNMFKEPQLQIFNLMKFDSYSRFLKSSLYQECMLAEVEGRPLPDPYQVPCSPAPSKHSFSSDRSTLTPTKKNDLRDDPLGKKKGNFFSWSRNRSFGKGPKKRDIGDFSYNSNGRRESQGSLSSGTSQELTSSSPGGKSEFEYRNSVATGEKGDRGPKQCSVSLPDGTNCHLALSHGTSIRQLLLELCRKHSVNLAAVDLFLIGGEKPLVLDQDSMTLCSRELRLEKRTLFRLDLVPINRSVGLKAKPTKPVTEVLRPVVAKYGLRLSDLVARISGETEILDLGLPISNLDGLRVVLERADPSAKEKSKMPFSKCHTPPTINNMNRSTPGDNRTIKSPKETPRDKKRDPCTPDGSKKKSNKKRADEAEELFELLSRAQSSRVDDQRGLLRKEDLVLPDFLRLDSPPTLTPKPNPDPDHPVCSTPTSHKTGQPKGQSATTPHPTQHSTDTQHSCPTHPANTGTEGVRGDDGVGNDSGDREQLPFCAPVSPILRPMGRALEEETPADLTLVGEGDISSPNSTLLPVPMPPTPPRPSPSAPILPEATYTPPPPCLHPPTTAGAEAEDKGCNSAHGHWKALFLGPNHISQDQTLSSSPGIGLEGVRLEEDPDLSLSFEGYANELRECQSRMKSNTYPLAAEPRCHLTNESEGNEDGAGEYKATFV